MDHVVESLRLIEWDGNRHLADALAVPAVDESVKVWLADRPITSIEFRDDLEVRISLAASAQDLWPTLQTNLREAGRRRSAAWRGGMGATASAGHHAHGRRQSARRSRRAGCGRRAAHGRHFLNSRRPGRWARRWSVTGVSGSVGGSKLRTARAAEALALEGIRTRLNAMSFDQTMTLGDAAHKDPHIEEAITRSLRQPRISKVEYDAPQPGAVRVQMQLDPQAVWRAIAGK